MSDEPPEQPPEAPLPAPPPPKALPPVHGRTLALCLFGLVPVGIIMGLSAGLRSTIPLSNLLIGALIGGFLMLIPGIAWALGLLLAGRFYRDEGKRVFAGLLFGIAIFLGTAAVLFAGCMCAERGRQ